VVNVWLAGTKLYPSSLGVTRVCASGIKIREE